MSDRITVQEIAKQFAAVVFDMDDTLVDSKLDFTFMRKELGVPASEFILEYLEKLPEKEQIEKHKKLEAIELAACESAELFPSVSEALNYLSEQKLKIGLFTRNCRSVVNRCQEKFRLPLDKVVAREDAPPKPEPDGLQQFLDEWSLQKETVLFVGDFRFDVECGKKVGVYTALFTNHKNIAEDFGADYLLYSYSLA